MQCICLTISSSIVKTANQCQIHAKYDTFMSVKLTYIKVYISFWTISLPCPNVLVKRSENSMIGVDIFSKLKLMDASSEIPIISSIIRKSFSRRSWVPLIVFNFSGG